MSPKNQFFHGVNCDCDSNNSNSNSTGLLDLTNNDLSAENQNFKSIELSSSVSFVRDIAPDESVSSETLTLGKLLPTVSIKRLF